MKKYLFTLALLIMVGSTIIGNNTNQQINKKNNIEFKITGEVEYWFEWEYDREGNVIGSTLVVKNNTSNGVTVEIVLSENGKKFTITAYIPAREQKMVYYGNETLQVIDGTWEPLY